MTACPNCDRENRAGARYCDSCGAALAEGAVAVEQRKTVTVLFCDVTGSTELGERLDPEALRGVLARYFERMKSIVERHGGTVEKFIGDAVMAVFGVPAVHEDDALRAARAALEMRKAFDELDINGRIGVATGQVVTGTEERLATGDAVNVAARIEQAAQPGEILISEETYRLTRKAAVVEVLEPLMLKGKSAAVPVYRLESISGDAERRHDTPMVGRDGEQRLLSSVWERVVSERACQLFTILGTAGVGKSRLVAEFLTAIPEALVVSGRCLSYGEGITYWPVVEVVKQLPESAPDPVAAETLRALLGEQQLVTSSEEIAWAFRKQLEVVAQERPLVCVFDDLHWGEETFLDLVEHVADLSRDAPILLLCMARPELLDRRTSWGGGKVNASTVLLEPLPPGETALLIESLAQVDGALRARIQEAAEGNPLYVVEMVALLDESGDENVSVPPTIQALLAARLDQLEPVDRRLLQCGAVEGRIFHRGAIEALNPGATDVTKRLTSLVRKDLIRPDTGELPGEEAFRFRHMLIRDAAYDALPKAVRAELHELFAAWLEKHGSTLVELDELLGYHLEQAARFKRDLGAPDRGLAERAAAKLGLVGRRAHDRGDMDGASNLLTRAVGLLEEGDRSRIELEAELGEALLEGGRLGDAETLLEAAAGRATESGDELLSARVQVGLANVRLQTHGAASHPRIQSDLEPLVALFEEAADHRGAADTLRILGKLATWDSDYVHGPALQERALLHARLAGDERREAAVIRNIVSDALWGPEHVDSALARCRGILAETQNRRSQANCLVRIGGLEGLAGRFDAARKTIAQARAIMDEFGLRHLKAHSSDVAVIVEMLAGEYETAELEAREAHALLEQMGDRTYQASQAHLIAAALEAQGRVDEAEEWLVASRGLDNPDRADLALHAQIMARRGDLHAAELLARSALEEGADSPVPVFGDPLFTLAEVLSRSGRLDEAQAAAEESLRCYEAKGIAPLARQAKLLLTQISEDRESNAPKPPP